MLLIPVIAGAWLSGNAGADELRLDAKAQFERSVTRDVRLGAGAAVELDIDIDREQAARYGVSVGDIQDVIEIALGGRVITMTVEGRERFPVRVRYARAFRDDEESVKNLFVSGSSMVNENKSGGSSDGADMGNPENPMPGKSAAGQSMQIPLSQLADVRIVSGPSMIRSENGLLRSFVRLNVRDRDSIGFVEEAQIATMIGLAPILWATGTGSEIMQPMAAPVPGGSPVADEVVDLLLPVLFYRVRVYRWKKIHAAIAKSQTQIAD